MIETGNCNRRHTPLDYSIQSNPKPFNIEVKYLPLLARSFSPIVMNSLINEGRSFYLNDILQGCGMIKELDLSMKLGQFFEYLYYLIAKLYRNEYVYKNAIVNKILLGKYSLNTSSILTEFRIGERKADVVILNGTSIAYEIKTEYDSLDRLQDQLSAYVRTFDMTNVITSNSQLSSLEKILPDEIGLLELTNNYTIRTVRGAQSLKARVRPEFIFNSLRKPEYLSIVESVYGYIPNVPNTYIYKVCLELFSKLSSEVAHDEMVRVLFQRGNKELLKEFISNIPSSLRAYVSSGHLTSERSRKLKDLLNSQLGTVLQINARRN